MDHTSLDVMSTYKVVEIALSLNGVIKHKIEIDHKNASKLLMITIAQLLSANNLHLSDLSYISVNQGPGPFTTLRTVIASMNGIAFATNLPLIGIDALSALAEEHASDSEITVALLNAFGGDVYYAVKHNDTKTTGYQNAQEFLSNLAAAHKDQQFLFIGAGVLLYEEDIKKYLGSRATIAHPLPEHCSLSKLAQLAYEKWQSKEDLKSELFPLYLKTHSALIGM